MSHSPTPWTVKDGYNTLVESEGLAIANVGARKDSIGGSKLSEQSDNAARIVSCVNACEGLNPEGIKDVVSAFSAILEVMEGSEQLKTLCEVVEARKALEKVMAK